MIIVRAINTKDNNYNYKGLIIALILLEKKSPHLNFDTRIMSQNDVVRFTFGMILFFS